MSTPLNQVFPAAEELLQLEPEEIAPLLLKWLASQNHLASFNRYTFMGPSGDLRAYAGTKYTDVSRSFMEAWMVLEREGLVAPDPEHSTYNIFFVTRRGKSLATEGSFMTHFRGNLLPAASLDPTLVSKVRHLFIRGDYDTAVFAAFKEVEVQVRVAGELPADVIGVSLMRQAFAKDGGPLADPTRLPAEQEAAAHLFAGAIGLFKNPPSHRAVEYSPEEAADLIRFANYLIRWIRRDFMKSLASAEPR